MSVSELKEKAFKTRRLLKSEQEAIANNQIPDKRLNAMPVEHYEPLFKKLTALVPIDRNRYR